MKNMKNVLKKVFTLGIMSVLLLSKDAVVSFAMGIDGVNIPAAASENTTIETEVILEVNSDFTGEITSEMKELGVISLEKIFDIGDTVMYLARLENAPADVLEKLQEIPDINSAEYNQMAFTTDAVATPKKEILLPMLIAVSIVAVVVIKIILSKRRTQQITVC